MSKISWRRSRRVAALGAVCTAALFALAGVASAHVTVNPDTAQQGGYAKVSFRVPNERDKASTTQLEVTIPTDHPIASVSTRAVPGWTATVQKTTLATPIKTDDGTPAAASTAGATTTSASTSENADSGKATAGVVLGVVGTVLGLIGVGFGLANRRRGADPA